MNADNKNIPDFFEDEQFDPVTTATGGAASAKPVGQVPATQSDRGGWNKKKAGFYLPKDLIERFNRKYHQLNLEGVVVGNKSALLETILEFGLEEMDRGSHSEIQKRLTVK